MPGSSHVSPALPAWSLGSPAGIPLRRPAGATSYFFRSDSYLFVRFPTLSHPLPRHPGRANSLSSSDLLPLHPADSRVLAIACVNRGNSYLARLSCDMTPLACPLCDTTTAQQVRAGLLDQHLGVSVVGVLLPFAIVFAIVAVVHFGWPWEWRKR